jgi:gluconate kinase
MAGKRQSVLKRSADKTHRANVQKAIKGGLLQGNARLEFLKQPAVKKQMKEWYRKNATRFIKQSI